MYHKKKMLISLFHLVPHDKAYGPVECVKCNLKAVARHRKITNIYDNLKVILQGVKIFQYNLNSKIFSELFVRIDTVVSL